MLARSMARPGRKTIHRMSDEDTTFLCEKQPQQEAAGRSPLTNKLLPLGENITGILDYEEDPEVIAAAANIPRMDDVEMQDVGPPLGFDPEVGQTGYNHNLVRASDEGALGSNSPVKTGCWMKIPNQRLWEMDDRVLVGTPVGPTPTRSNYSSGTIS